MNRKNLEEIVALVDKALASTKEKVIDTEVEPMTKTAYISIGGVLDSIKILALANLGHYDEAHDNIDRPEKHNIAGSMNKPSRDQLALIEEERY